MDSKLAPLAEIFALNTDLLANCLEAVTDAQANERLQGRGNSIAFLVAHLTDVRHHLASLLGSVMPNPLAAVLADAQSIDDIGALPPIGDLLDAWRAISNELARTLAHLTEADLRMPTPQSYPIPGGTVLDAIAFMAQHDSYHLGQVAFLRRQAGLPSMPYRRAPRSPGETDTQPTTQ